MAEQAQERWTIYGPHDACGGFVGPHPICTCEGTFDPPLPKRELIPAEHERALEGQVQSWREAAEAEQQRVWALVETLREIAEHEPSFSEGEARALYRARQIARAALDAGGETPAERGAARGLPSADDVRGILRADSGGEDD